MIKTLWGKTYIKRICYVVVLVAVWGILFSLKLFSPLLFPGPLSVLQTLVREVGDGSLLVKAGMSLLMIFIGMLISIAIVVVLMTLVMLSKALRDLCGTLISVLDPLPGLALLPIAILWFGIGDGAIIFIMIHSILWPILLSVITGFDAVPLIYREVGMGMGLSKMRMMTGIYIPSALPNILAGLKTGWARAWRSLIAAEMVFGAAGNSAGLGWDIYIKRSYLDMPGMIATLIIIMIIGILMEDFFFKRVEKSTIVKWGMVR